MGGERLRDKFPRLYRLESDKGVSVMGRGNWVDGVWRWEWSWVRVPKGRAEGERKD